MVEGFDKIINETDDHSDLEPTKLYLNKMEEKSAANIIAQVNSKQNKSTTIVIQPFGRSARVDNGDIIDDSSRSIDPSVYTKLVKKLSQKYNIIFMVGDSTGTHLKLLDHDQQALGKITVGRSNAEWSSSNIRIGDQPEVYHSSENITWQMNS